jgi:hypothetical protein
MISVWPAENKGAGRTEKSKTIDFLRARAGRIHFEFLTPSKYQDGFMIRLIVCDLMEPSPTVKFIFRPRVKLIKAFNIKMAWLWRACAPWCGFRSS